MRTMAKEDNVVIYAWPVTRKGGIVFAVKITALIH
jgi:hypothetical protein